MRNIILFLALIMFSCSGSKKSQLESEISKIYGSDVSGKSTDEGYVYELDYNGKSYEIPTDAQKLKDVTDRVLGVLPTEKFSDVMDNEGTSLSDIYYWEMPELRILLKATRSLNENDQKILYVITEK